MKKSQKNYLLVAILVLFVTGGGNVFAAANSDDENSVHNWGPWKKMASPAAGPERLDKTNIPVATISKENELVKDDLKDSDFKHER